MLCRPECPDSHSPPPKHRLTAKPPGTRRGFWVLMGGEVASGSMKQTLVEKQDFPETGLQIFLSKLPE